MCKHKHILFSGLFSSQELLLQSQIKLCLWLPSSHPALSPQVEPVIAAVGTKIAAARFQKTLGIRDMGGTLYSLGTNKQGGFSVPLMALAQLEMHRKNQAALCLGLWLN